MVVNLNQGRNQILGTDHDLCYKDYPLYCKGMGVICTRKEGIPANTLVTEFFGNRLNTLSIGIKSSRIRQKRGGCLAYI